MAWKSQSEREQEERDEAKEAIREALTTLSLKTKGLEDLIAAIEKLIDVKIEHALSDMDDKINKRGMYDPDY